MRPAAILLALVCSLALLACGDTLQDQPIPHNELEELIVSPFPVYWLGGSFHGLAITEASHDGGGAYTLQYGNCLQGGQGTCLPPLRIVTSPDNGFVPGGAARVKYIRVRGVGARVAEAGRAILIATGPVVVGVYANDARLAHTAAQALVPINEPAAPAGPLSAPLPDTGYGSQPLPAQEPQPLHPVR